MHVLFLILAPMFFIGWSTLYSYLGEELASRYTFYFGLSAILSTPLALYFRNAVITANYLLSVLTLTTLSNCIAFGPYALSNLAWAFAPIILIPYAISFYSRLFWNISSIAVGGFIIYSSQSITLSVDFDFRHFAILTAINFIGPMSIIAISTNMSVKTNRQDRDHLEDSKYATKVLLRTVVHDITNSLSLIKSSHSVMKRFLKDGKIPPDKALSSAEAGVNKAARLVSQIREMEGVSSGKIELNKESLSVGEMVLETLDALGHLFESKNIEVHFSEPSEIILTETNSNSFKVNLLENILSNAVKYSYSGSKIDLILAYKDNIATLTIKDYGHGISEDILNKIYSEDKKTNVEGTLGEKGTGFGMFIVSTFAELLDIKVSIYSKVEELYPEDHGTEIILTFPACQQNKSEQPAQLAS